MSVLFQLRRSGSILAYGAEHGFWFEIDNNPATTAIADGAAGLYQLHNDGSIWEFAGGSPPVWNPLDNNPATTAIAVGRDLYQLHNDGSVFQYTGSPLWPRLDNNPATIAIVAFTEVIL